MYFGAEEEEVLLAVAGFFESSGPAMVRCLPASQRSEVIAL